MANGNGTTRTLVMWLLGVLATVLAAVIVGGGAASIATKIDVGKMSVEQTTMKEDIGQLKTDVREIDNSLQLHRLESPRLPGGGGGGS